MKTEPRRYRSLREWRLERKLTVTQAATLIGIPVMTYYGIERGSIPRPPHMRQIMERTGVTADVLAQVA
jgi:transcriptional regulator with XRE-family HTH domain